MRIETERLILREIDPQRDFDAWAHMMADPNTVKYLGCDVMDRALAWRNMAMVLGHWSIRGFGFFSVEEKATGDWVGRVGPWNPEGWPEPEVGWAIAPEHYGKGYGTEAGKASVDFAFNTLGWKKVVHVILQGNIGSMRVAEKIGSPLLRTQDGLPGITKERVSIYGQSASA